MNIGLLAVDSNYPNLALMKISAWHKARGDNVGWYNPFNRYDKVYMEGGNYGIIYSPTAKRLILSV